MPEFDGFAVLDALQQMPAWRDTPVFVWTGMALSEADYSGLAHSARTILRKRGGSLHAAVDALRRWQPSAALRPATDTHVALP